jgi:hypothetical protein
MLRHLIYLSFSFLLASCESYRTVYASKALIGREIRLSRYFDGCCGCRANIIDVKTSDTTEFRYFIHCDCESFSSGYVKKDKILTDGKKVLSITRYKSLQTNEQPDFEIPFNNLDSLVLINIPTTVTLDFKSNCDSSRQRLKSLVGFIEIGEYKNPKNIKPYFRKKVKLYNPTY